MLAYTQVLASEGSENIVLWRRIWIEILWVRHLSSFSRLAQFKFWGFWRWYSLVYGWENIREDSPGMEQRMSLIIILYVWWSVWYFCIAKVSLSFALVYIPCTALRDGPLLHNYLPIEPPIKLYCEIQKICFTKMLLRNVEFFYI